MGSVAIEDAETSLLDYYAIVVRFYMDKDGNLIDYTVQKEREK